LHSNPKRLIRQAGAKALFVAQGARAGAQAPTKGKDGAGPWGFLVMSLRKNPTECCVTVCG
jgi:hypothetical protein